MGRFGLFTVPWLAFVSCVGNIGGDGGEAQGVPPGELSEEAESEVATSGLRRLSVDEYSRTVADLVGLAPEAARELLPVDNYGPFDNDYTMQTPSEALIKGAELIAGDIAEAVVADPALRAKVVGCEPAGPDDEACMRSFVTAFGRRALRRPLEASEQDRFVALLEHGVAAGDFWVAAGAALRAFLQHPELLYRVEIGEPVPNAPGVFALDNHEIGARLSYFLIGSTPPDWLLDEADAGALTTTEGLTAAAERLLDSEQARARIGRFHAMWLSYAQLGDSGTAAEMKRESEALLERVIFDDRRPWTDVLTATETFLSPALAEHYGLPSPGAEGGWVDYGDSGRKGILSHGTFLSAVAKFGDTSPTQRGLLVRTRLLCQQIGKPPPDLNINVDEPPSVDDPNACKTERYFMSREDACKGCHSLMDPIGFGLERFGADGKLRDSEPGRPECSIDGDGEVVGVGSFNGPAELADLLVASGRVEACVIEQLYRFAAGRAALDEYDERFIARLAEVSSSEGLELFTFIKSYVTSDAFRFRRDEETP
jgi:hypothetical protein